MSVSGCFVSHKVWHMNNKEGAWEMKKIFRFFYGVAVVWAVCLSGAPIFGTSAYAEPVAQVAVFEGGKGLEEFLDRFDASKITRIERTGEGDEAAILVLPLQEGSNVEIYGTALNEETFEVIPKRGGQDDLIARADGSGILFWGHVSEGMPSLAVIVCFRAEDDWREHFWFPAFSGIDGSLETNDEFIPFEKEEE